MKFNETHLSGGSQRPNAPPRELGESPHVTHVCERPKPGSAPYLTKQSLPDYRITVVRALGACEFRVEGVAVARRSGRSGVVVVVGAARANRWCRKVLWFRYSTTASLNLLDELDQAASIDT